MLNVQACSTVVTIRKPVWSNDMQEVAGKRLEEINSAEVAKLDQRKVKSFTILNALANYISSSYDIHLLKFNANCIL